MQVLRQPRARVVEQTPLPVAPPVAAAPREKPYPRWVVVSGMIIYCVLCWFLIWTAGGWLIGFFSGTLRNL